MTEKQLEKLETELKKASYRRYEKSRFCKCDYSWAHRVNNAEGDMIYQIVWEVYDRRPYVDCDPYIKEHPFGVEVKVYASHGTQLHLWGSEYTIPQVEKVAKDFYELMKTHKLTEE